MASEQQSARPAAVGGAANHVPAVSLPKGGGAIRGIGEKLGMSPATGTASMSVPIELSPGRGGFGPELALSYDTSAGNGPFGFGWSLNLPSIARKTDRGVPRYRDQPDPDVFVLAGVEDLVPVLRADGTTPETWPAGEGATTYTVRRYRPRVEAGFARIERWTDDGTGADHWRVRSPDNVTTVYGPTPASRLTDPDDGRRVFAWLIAATYDTKGHLVVYEYKAEDSAGVPNVSATERNRTAGGRAAQRYIKRIKYGATTPYEPGTPLAAPRTWLFEVVFDYGEGHLEPLPPDARGRPRRAASTGEGLAWATRADAFSSYRSGFEVRTYRRSAQIVMFHHVPPGAGGEAPYEGAVAATTFSYQESPIASFLTAITRSGYRKQADGAFLGKSLPALELSYSAAVVDDTVRELDAASVRNLPGGIDGGRARWLDLDGEGFGGVLIQQDGGWYFKSNLSPAAAGAARLGGAQPVALEPSLAASGRGQFLDLAGDGRTDFAVFDRPVGGVFERDEAAGWDAFRAFTSQLALDAGSPHGRFVDLTGDGFADLLVAGDDGFSWCESLGEEGFGAVHHVAWASDEERGPRLVFGDPIGSVHLADMSGDGLTDLVRITNGEVCYWPSLGHGRFGPRVVMDSAPRFDSVDQFDARRLRLADIDGSGATDIVYLGSDGARLYFNQSGNSWSPARPLPALPALTNVDAVDVVDLFGTGTACLVWSSPLAAATESPVRYVDLMGGTKPHLLALVANNLGAETRIEYAPSTRFALADKLAGRPWVTRLPFPVQVVERLEVLDLVGGNRFVTRYAYHHGCFDGSEREFRGFGMVEQWDTEEFAASGVVPGAAAANEDAASHVPPTYTRTWYHTGSYLREGYVSRQYAHEYYGAPPGDVAAFAAFLDGLVPDTVLPGGLSPDELVEACRALRGSTLREEVYALDGTSEEPRPYSISERNQTVRLVQRRGPNRHGVFHTHVREALTVASERQPADARTSHEFVLRVDGFGNVLRAVAVAYPRPPGPTRSTAQAETHIRFTLHTVANQSGPDAYRIGAPVETRMYEVVKPPTRAAEFSFEQIDALITGLVPDDRTAPDASVVVPSEGWDWRQSWDPAADPGGPATSRLRLVEHVRTTYRADDLSGLLPLGSVGGRGLPGEALTRVLTPGLVTRVFGTDVTAAMLEAAGYRHSEGDIDWWAPSGQVFYSPLGSDTPAQELAVARARFFQPHRFVDPFGNETHTWYDAHALLLLRSQDAVGNTTAAGEVDASGDIDSPSLDYRVLRPSLVTDPNGNRSQVVFDALGLPVATVVMGKRGGQEGDELTGPFDEDLDDATIAAFVADPTARAAGVLGHATSRLVYDIGAFDRTRTQPRPDPAATYTLAREFHRFDASGPGPGRVDVTVTYSDGLGREVQTKARAGPGPVVPGAATLATRWVGSAWTVYNNKGKPVREYEPFFTSTHAFEFAPIQGVSSILCYDPLGRVIATLHPDGSWEKVSFGPWEQRTWDRNDTTTIDPYADPEVASFFHRLFPGGSFLTWYVARAGGALGPAELAAAVDAASHGGTATESRLDALGRVCAVVTRNRWERDGSVVDERSTTEIVLDFEGRARVVRDAKPDPAQPARGRAVVRHDYDLVGVELAEDSVDGGRRCTLGDVQGHAAHAWDGLGRHFWTERDFLRRPVRVFADGGPEAPAAPVLYEWIVYGEADADGVARNARGRVSKHYDCSGLVTNDRYDFKGNALGTSRRLARDYRTTVDWSGGDGAKLEAETFTTAAWFDARDRPIQVVAPHSDRTTISVLRPVYEPTGLLAAEYVWLDQPSVPTGVLDPGTASLRPVTSIEYDAKGQRRAIAYGNGVSTTYVYDATTFRLRRLTTRRPGGRNGSATQLLRDATVLQDLSYVYDPVGNITQITDGAAVQVVYAGQVVTPGNRFRYDALSRLVEAEGREHVAQCSYDPGTRRTNNRDLAFAGLGPATTDPRALRTYRQRYDYDAVGNLTAVQHRAAGGDWTLRYDYGPLDNRLRATSVPGDPAAGPYSASYTYDAHGAAVSMPHLDTLTLDVAGRLRSSVRQRQTSGVPETTYYTYDAAGQRVRKVTDGAAAGTAPATAREERIYLGLFEVYRRYGPGGTLERESLHVMDDRRRILTIDTKTTDGGVPANRVALHRYQLGDHLGSAALEVSADADVISYEEYHPYGTSSLQVGPAGAEVSPKRYRYTGKERDEETGFGYHGARYYAPWLARWVSCDPAGILDSACPYAYCRDNPVVGVDASGKETGGFWETLGGFFYGVGSTVTSTYDAFYESTGGLLYQTAQNFSADHWYYGEYRGEQYKQMYEKQKGSWAALGKAAESPAGLVLHTLKSLVVPLDEMNRKIAQGNAPEAAMALGAFVPNFMATFAGSGEAKLNLKGGPPMGPQFATANGMSLSAAAATKSVTVPLPGPGGLVVAMKSEGKEEAAAPPADDGNTLTRYPEGNRIVEKGGQYWNLPKGVSARRIPVVDKVGDMLQNAAWDIAKRWNFSKLSAAEWANIVKQRAAGTGGDYLAIAQARGRWVEAQLKSRFDTLKWSGQGPDATDPGTKIMYEIHSGSISNLDRHGMRPGMTTETWRAITF